MKKSDLLEAIKDMSDDADLVISQPFLIDEKEEIMAIVDLPIVGIATNTENDENEIRFIVKLDDAKSVFDPAEVTLL